MSEFEKELRRTIEERKVSGARYPDFFPFENEGDELLGSYQGSRTLEDRPIYTVEDLSGKSWSVGGTTIIRRLFDEEIRPQAGDYVLIRFDGWGRSKRGRRVKQFSVGKMSREEAEKLPRKPSKPIEITPPPKKPVEVPKPPPPRPEIPQADEMRDFFRRMFEFYDEMSKDDLEKSLARRFPKTSSDDVLEVCKDFIEYDKEKNLFKKR